MPDPVILHGVQGRREGGNTESLIRASEVLNEGSAGEWLLPLEAPVLFSIHQMSVRGQAEPAWGIRYNEEGGAWWYPWHYGSEQEARGVRDDVLLRWLEQSEEVLVEGFRSTVEKGASDETARSD